MSFPSMSKMAATLPSTSTPSPWTHTPTPQGTGIGPQPQLTTMEEFVIAYTDWQPYYAISPSLAGTPPTIPTICQPAPQSTVPQSAPTPSSALSSATPPTIWIPTSPMRHAWQAQPSFFRPALAAISQVPIPTSTGKIGKSITAKPEIYNGTKESLTNGGEQWPSTSWDSKMNHPTSNE